jgi:hypothetical protein
MFENNNNKYFRDYLPETIAIAGLLWYVEATDVTMWGWLLQNHAISADENHQRLLSDTLRYRSIRVEDFEAACYYSSGHQLQAVELTDPPNLRPSHR